MAQHSHPPRRVAQSPKQNTFFGGAAVLAAGILVVKLIGLFYKIPLLNIIGEQGTADFGNAYNIYAVLLTISTAGLPVAVSKLVSEANALGRQNQVRRTFRLAMALFLTLGVLSFLVMFFCADQLAGLMHDSMAAPGIKALAPAVICVGCLSAFRGYAQGHGRMTPTAVSQIIEALCKLTVGLGLAYWLVKHGADASHAAAGAITGVTVGTIVALAYMLMNFLITRGREGNLSDDQLRRIRDTGGVVGLNAFHGFVHAEPRQQTARTLALHAVHMAEVMGVEHVGCGFDFCEFMGPGNEGTAPAGLIGKSGHLGPVPGDRRLHRSGAGPEGVESRPSPGWGSHHGTAGAEHGRTGRAGGGRSGPAHHPGGHQPHPLWQLQRRAEHL